MGVVAGGCRWAWQEGLERELGVDAAGGVGGGALLLRGVGVGVKLVSRGHSGGEGAALTGFIQQVGDHQ